MEMIAHSYISDSAPNTMFDDVEDFAKNLMEKGRTSRGGRKPSRSRSFGGISKAFGGSRHGGGRLSGSGGGGRYGGGSKRGRHGGGRQKPRAKHQRVTKGRGKRALPRL
jgi:hypothetical protein